MENIGTTNQNPIDNLSINKQIAKKVFVTFAFLILFCQMVLSAHGYTHSYSETLFDSNWGWLCIDVVVLALNIAVISIMICNIKHGCTLCKIFAYFAIVTLFIACLSEILYISFNGMVLNDPYSSNRIKIINAAFGMDVIAIAPVALLTTISTIKTIKLFVNN